MAGGEGAGVGVVTVGWRRGVVAGVVGGGGGRVVVGGVLAVGISHGELFFFNFFFFRVYSGVVVDGEVLS